MPNSKNVISCCWVIGMDKIITLTPDELQKCKEFSIKSAKSQQAIEFGQTDTKARSVSEIARDNLIGKMAEVAFARMLKEDFNIDIPLDFNVYARGKWDDNDMVINGWNIDIKSTRIGHWLLIEWSKLNFRQKQGELPHAFFMCKTEWDMDKDEPVGTVDLVGSISLNKLKAGAPHIHTIRKGEFLPDTHTRLQADNFGVRFRNLNHKWSEVIPYILEHEPPTLDNYPNPYTGEIVPQYQNKECSVGKDKAVETDDFIIEGVYKTTKPEKVSIFTKLLRFLGFKR